MRGVKFLGMLVIAATLAGCGLPDNYYIQPPDALAPNPGLFFEFLNPDHTNDSTNVAFLGYELYYRFYADSISIIQNAYDQNDLISKGFLPVVSDIDSYPARTVPVVPIDSGDKAKRFSVHVNINTEGIIDSNFSFSFTGVIISPSGNLRRDVQDTPRDPVHFKTFFGNQTPGNAGNYDPLDPDCSLIASLLPTPPTFVYLAMYALSYGLTGASPPLTTPLRSIPKYLGSLNLRIN